MATFPVLNVDLNRVDKLDDCRTLWLVFSRCRDNVDDGARLENLSWRLWTRKLSSSRTDLRRPAFSLAASDSELSGFTSDDGSSASSVATSAKARRAPITARSERELRPDERQMASSQPSRALSSDARPALEPRSRSSPDLHPGRFITELIPNRLIVPAAAHNPLPAAPVPTSASVIARAAPVAHSHPLLLARPILETVVMPSTPPSAATTAYPAVVVVNPTPHPTPPATPRIPDEPPQSHPGTGSSLHVPGSDLPNKTHSHSRSVDHEAEGRKAAAAAAASRFYLCQEPVTPEQSPSESSTMGSTAATNSTGTGPIGAATRDSSVPPAPPNSVPKTSRSFDEVSVGVAGSATSSHFRAPSSIGSASRGRKGKEAVRHHVGNRAGSRPTFAHRNQHHKAHAPARAHTPAAKAPAPARGAQQGPVSRDPSPSASAAISPAVHGTNNARERPQSQTPAPAATAPPPPAHNTNTATVRPASPRVSLFKMLAPANRRVELATSSEFDSDSADDSSWASEDESVEVDRERNSKEPAAESKQPPDVAKQQPDIAREAALEAQRQRELFAKLPTRSWSNLEQAQRPGLLTSLFRPDLAQSRLARHSATVQDLTAAPRVMSSPAHSKAPAMAPLIQQVTAQPTRSGYRPRARPEGEPEDSDTDDVDPEDTVQLSRSVAQRKLEELAGNQRRRQQQQHQPQPEPGPSLLPAAIAPAVPIPFDHARLPAPLPPQTPRTTRRNMLASEMSESLRRNLLWERQVTKRSHGLPRNTSAGSRLQPMTSAVATEDESEARRKKAIARNKSFGDDFHRSGW